MIREFQKEDAPRVQKIALKCFDNNIRQDKKLYLAKHFVKSYFKIKNIEARLDHQYEFYVLTENEIIGFVEIQDGNTITNIFVDPPYQKQGYGTQLLKYAILRCQALNPKLDRVSLDAETQAIKFYEHCGFTSLSRSKTVMGVEMTMMEIKLKNN
ncbi:GNAT family N-acetyltransferase [Beduini massiliensis]|uniref:GNAT family N-acetyltransferase n=1 Tax=Beduini massiliensis TaxID=1585974 RepID=UPI00164CE545|nr:GNAT family N-acetyltransferase [Beduini massiliensis]